MHERPDPFDHYLYGTTELCQRSYEDLPATAWQELLARQCVK